MTRHIAINKLNSLLNDEKLSNKIENSIYNYTIEQSKIKGIDTNIENKFFKRIYVNKFITLYNNLDENSYIKNKSFLKRTLENEYDIENIAFLTPQEINKEHWKKYLDRQMANDDFLCSRTTGIKTSEYKCNRCKQNECTYQLLQIRSADEPMTTVINCLNCGHKWSFN
jgi:DNA-directed RNA polymerase subunit M/transcription elongation factor TFIIS